MLQNYGHYCQQDNSWQTHQVQFDTFKGKVTGQPYSLELQNIE